MIVKEVLPNGLTLVTESMPHVRSVAIGVWLKRGSRHETPAQTGISHFIEHMVFKGTRTRPAEVIAAQVDSIGGHMDAFTAKEYASFHLKVLDEHLPLAVDILGDIVANPLFDPEEMTKEKKVIFEEINMVEDTPDDLVMELLTEAFWPKHPARTADTRDQAQRRRASSAPELASFFREVYRPKNILISAAGHLDHEATSEAHPPPLRRADPGRRREERRPAAPGLEDRDPVEEGAGAGPPLPGRARPQPDAPRPLRPLHHEHRARGEHVVAAVPERAGEARPRVLHLVGGDVLLRRRAC